MTSVVPRTSSVAPREPPPRLGRLRRKGCLPTGGEGSAAPLPRWGDCFPHWGGPSERSEAGVGTTKEVLGFIIDFLDSNLDFLGIPGIFIRIS